ncbi:DnaT-like ssDNA-binding protein [Sphingomonas melonis]
MTPENGTGVTNANSYLTVAQATEFHADRGNDDWADASPAQMATALVRATDYIEATYRAHGDPLAMSQGLQWPRLGDWGLDPRVQRATAILALEALSGPLMGRATRGVKMELVEGDGAGKLQTIYDDAGPEDPFPHATAILSEIASLRASGGSSVTGGRVVRF